MTYRQFCSAMLILHRRFPNAQVRSLRFRDQGGLSCDWLPAIMDNQVEFRKIAQSLEFEVHDAPRTGQFHLCAK